MKKTDSVSLPGPMVRIVGQNALQNDLLAWYLKSEADIACATARDFSCLEDLDKDAGLPVLVLYDCLFCGPEALWAQMESPPAGQKPSLLYAMFNVTPSRELEREAMSRRVQGLFFVGTSLPIFKKGVMAMLGGELWYSRGTLSHLLLEKEPATALSNEAALFLTQREKEILAGIAEGATNQEIAERLFISLHTVKSHIYNIYKKIHVSNRLQAARWVAGHLKRS